MAKKKRLEQDPSIDPKTGKKRERRLGRATEGGKEGSWIEVDIKLTTEQRESALKAMNEAAEKVARNFISGSSAFSGLFGGHPNARHSMGGNIFIEGGDGRFRPWIEDMYRNPAIRDYLDSMLGPKGDPVDMDQAVSRMLHNKAIEVWESLLNWQFAVTHNEGQDTYWFTARYYDTEECDSSLPLVSETLEFSGERLAKDNWDETNLEVERQMERLHEKCVADLAAFE